MVAPEVPRRRSVRQAILHDQAHGDRHDSVRIMTPGEGHIRHVGVEIMVAVSAVMLRIGEVDIVGVLGDQVPQVVQKSLDAPQARGSRAAARTLAISIVAAADDGRGLRQVFDTRDALCHVGKVFTRSWHSCILQGRRCSSEYIASFPRSTPEKLCNDATVSFLPIFRYDDNVVSAIPPDMALVLPFSHCGFSFLWPWRVHSGRNHIPLHESTPERQSLFESHRQRRWLTYWR